MKNRIVENYRGFQIEQTGNDGFGVAGYGFYPGPRMAWVGTFLTPESARAGIDRRLDPLPPTSMKKDSSVVAVRATTCRRCSKSDLFDGAMFTTDPSSGLCDDCYG